MPIPLTGGIRRRMTPAHSWRALQATALVVVAGWALARYRRWHSSWGATPEEVRSPMPGDELVPKAQFCVTRAITIAASRAEIWPWLMQVGFGRAGFYSYDLLDNLGRRSADDVLPQWQQLGVGDIAAPMTDPPTPGTSFVIHDMQPPERLVWAKPDSTWAWRLTALNESSTRVVTRLKQHYRLAADLPLTVLLMEVGDFPMMRRMLLVLKARAEQAARHPT